MTLSGRKPELADPAETYLGQWVLRHDGKDYPADSLEVLAEWFRRDRVPSNCKIFHPEEKEWRSRDEIVPLLIAQVTITTTPTLDGHRVVRYLGIESVEVVIGTGPFSEFTAGVSDFFGARSTAFERKLQQAKDAALKKLRFLALRRGGNAIVGVDLDYTEFSGNRIGIIANGTVVQVERTSSG